jgi:uncharacterized integral membrane protein
MVSRLVWILIVAPVAIVLIALSVANREPVNFTIDPFNPQNPALTYSLPLYAYLFAALIIGLLLGAITTWLAQGRYRRQSRQRELELERLKAEARKRDSELRTAVIPAS